MTQELVERPRGGDFRHDEATIHRALTELAACSGNTHKAARHLEQEELHLEPKTIWRWANKQHVETYARIRSEVLPRITEAAADQHMALARQQMSLAQQAAALVADRMPSMDDRDLINAMGKADIGSGIHTEKAQLLAGQPTQRVEKSAGDVLRKLKARGMKVVDGNVAEAIEVEEVTSSSSAVAVQASDGQS